MSGGAAQQQQPQPQTCPRGHVLEVLDDSHFFTCDACGAREFAPPVYHCGVCSIDLCPSCQLARTLQTPLRSQSPSARASVAAFAGPDRDRDASQQQPLRPLPQHAMVAPLPLKPLRSRSACPMETTGITSPPPPQLLASSGVGFSALPPPSAIRESESLGGSSASLLLADPLPVASSLNSARRSTSSAPGGQQQQQRHSALALAMSQPPPGSAPLTQTLPPPPRSVSSSVPPLLPPPPSARGALPPLVSPRSGLPAPVRPVSTQQNRGATTFRPDTSSSASASPGAIRVGSRVLLPRASVGPGGTGAGRRLAVVTAVCGGLARVAVDGCNAREPVPLADLVTPPGGLFQAPDVPTPQGCGMTCASAVFGPVRVGSLVVVGPRRPLDGPEAAKDADGPVVVGPRHAVGKAATVTALCGVDEAGCPVVSVSVDGVDIDERPRVRDLMVITP